MTTAKISVTLGKVNGENKSMTFTLSGIISAVTPDQVVQVATALEPIHAGIDKETITVKRIVSEDITFA